jgi:hypothetical protein
MSTRAELKANWLDDFALVSVSALDCLFFCKTEFGRASSHSDDKPVRTYVLHYIISHD